MTYLRGNPQSIATARDLCEAMIEASGANAQSVLDALISAETGAGTVSVLRPMTEETPAYYAAASAGHCWLFMEGCTTLRHGLNTVAGYTGTVADGYRDPVNSYFKALAAAALADAENVWPPTPARMTLVGHSLGGAAMTVAAQTICTQGRGSILDLCTFGAPKPLGSSGNAVLAYCNVARWFNDDDPVPLVMPTADDNPAILAAFSIREALRFQNFAQPAGGIELFGQGRNVPGILPSSASIQPVTALAAWLVSLDGSTHTPHDLDAYLYRFDQWIADHPTQVLTASRVGPAEVPTSPPPRQVTKAQAAVVRAVRDQEQAQLAARFAVPPAQVVRVVRLGRLWAVVAGDNQLALTARKTSARRLARRLNAALESMQLQPLLNRDTVQHWIDGYLAEASAPDGGFSPTIKDVLAGV